MIFTITLNPSLDYILKTQDFKLSQTNRSKDERLYPAGKGINVSLMLKNLGISSKPLGFLAGFSGKEIERLLLERGISGDFVMLGEGNSRINVKISSNTETELNARGPLVGEEDLLVLFQKLEKLQDGDILVLSGSLPMGVESDIYAKIMEICQCKDIKVIVDCPKEPLRKALEFQPFLIKPNRVEVEDFFDLQDLSLEQLKQCAKDLQNLGARNVIISLAGDGAVCAGSSIFHIQAPKGELKNSVGAGDSMVAGMIAGLERGMNEEDRFIYALACGSASAFSEDFATLTEVEQIFKTLKERINEHNRFN